MSTRLEETEHVLFLADNADETTFDRISIRALIGRAVYDFIVMFRLIPSGNTVVNRGK